MQTTDDVAHVALPLAPPDGDDRRRGLAWQGVGFQVSTRTTLDALLRRPSKGPKQILHDVSGLVRAGEVLFIMGPSGAGKSSMLDSLANRVKGQVLGHVWIDGQQSSEARFRAAAKYVEQKDNLFETFTTYETLMYAAEFYCAKKEERVPRVESVIERLGLESARNTKCGGTFYRGLSGGQLRRVSIGIELVAQPDILALDEPTSGLDSSSAMQVMSHLRHIARSGVAVICTIHQPSQRIFEMSDKLLLLSMGHVAYCGPTRDVIPYFNARGCVMPAHTSTSEWLLDELNSDFHGSPDRVQELLATWNSSSEKLALDAEVRDFAGADKHDDHEFAKSATKRTSMAVFKRSFLEQSIINTKRNLIDAMRSPAVIYLRAAMYFALAILIGIGWLRIPAQAIRINQITGVLFFTAAFMIFMSIAVLPVYLNEKQIVTRERVNGGYSTGAYLMGHFIVEIIFLAVLAILVTAVLYYLVGLNPKFTRACFFALTLVVSLLTAESIMILIAAVVPFLLVGIAIGAFLFGGFMVVQGYLTPIRYIPWPLRWMQYIGLHSYSFGAFCINEFSGRTYSATPKSFPAFLSDVAGETVLQSLTLPLANRWANIGVMLAMVAVYRTLAYLWISTFHNGKR